MIRAILIALMISPAAAKQPILYGMDQAPVKQSEEQEVCDFKSIYDAKGKIIGEQVRCYCYGPSSDKNILNKKG